MRNPTRYSKLRRRIGAMSEAQRERWEAATMTAARGRILQLGVAELIREENPNAVELTECANLLKDAAARYAEAEAGFAIVREEIDAADDPARGEA